MAVPTREVSDMEVVLLERIPRLGQMGDVVDVRPGYARNFLLPRGKALRANKANMERFEQERAEIEARDLARKAEAESVREKLDDATVVLIRQAADTGNLYGSVSSRDIAVGLDETGVRIERQQLVLERAIKVIGLHEVRIALHPEVEAVITVNVARSDDEAELQAQGKSIGDIEDEIDRELDAELAVEAAAEGEAGDDPDESEAAPEGG